MVSFISGPQTNFFSVTSDVKNDSNSNIQECCRLHEVTVITQWKNLSLNCSAFMVARHGFPTETI